MYMTKEVIIYGFNYNVVKISFLHDINSCLYKKIKQWGASVFHPLLTRKRMFIETF